MSSRLRSERGQSAVELVVLLPVVVLLLAGAWQLVLAGHARWSASAAAHAAARARAIGLDALPAARASLPASLDRRVEVEETARGVAVRLTVPSVVPGLELGTLTAHATFANQQ